MSDPTPYDPMSPLEIAELSREAGRDLTPKEAMEYLKRRTHSRSVDQMLEAPSRDLDTNH